MAGLTLKQFFDKSPDVGASYLEDWVKKGKSFTRFMHFDEEFEKFLYQKGYHCFIKNDLSRSEELFSFLTLLNGFHKEYWKALAAAQYNQSKFSDAIHSYTISLIIDPEDIESIFNIALSYKQLNEKTKALNALDWAATFRLNDSERHQLQQIKRELKS